MNSCRLGLMLVPLVLMGCATERVVGGRVPLITYSPEFLKQAKSERVVVCPIAPNTCTLVNDYGKTRDAIRAIDKQ